MSKVLGNAITDSEAKIHRLDSSIAKLDRKVSLGRATRADVNKRNELVGECSVLRSKSL